MNQNPILTALSQATRRHCAIGRQGKRRYEATPAVRQSADSVLGGDIIPLQQLKQASLIAVSEMTAECGAHLSKLLRREWSKWHEDIFGLAERAWMRGAHFVLSCGDAMKNAKCAFFIVVIFKRLAGVYKFMISKVLKILNRRFGVLAGYGMEYAGCRYYRVTCKPKRRHSKNERQK
jgi:hypothetical protein